MSVQPIVPTDAATWVQAKSVLIVDDDPAISDMMCAMLSRADRFLYTAYCLEQAEQMLRARNFDLVLLDLSLPDGCGMDLLLRHASRYNKTRFVILTADESASMVIDAMRGGAYDVMRKPLLLEELQDWMDRWLEPFAGDEIEMISVRPYWIEMSIPCSSKAVDRAGRFLWNLQSDLPQDFRDQLTDCFRELALNAVEWGGNFDINKRVRISYLRTARLVQFRITDPGKGFRFDRLSHAAVGQITPDPLTYARVREEMGLRPGGLGLLIVRSLADDLVYNETQNEVVFMKQLP